MPSLKYRSPTVLLLTGIFFLSIACGGVSQDDLQHLKGYWEIRMVTFPDGVRKEYSVSTTIDYYELQGVKGFRKKMQPTLEGSYRTSDDALPMRVVFREDRVFLAFEGGTERWEEEILELDSSSLVTEHENGLKYAYIRYEPINLSEDAQK